MNRNRLLLGLAIFITALGGFVLYQLRGNPSDPLDRGKQPLADEYLGKTKAFILQKYGTPNLAWDGHYGLPPADYVEQHNPCITLVYKRLTGTLYLSFEMKDDDWVCFSSQWLPKGAVF